MGMGEIERRLDRADAAACLALGRTKALEYGIRFLLMANPEPQAIAAGWQAFLPLIADEHAEAPDGLPDPSMYQAGLQQALAEMTGQIELAAMR